MAQENDIPLNDFNPSWMEDGFGLIGEQPDYQDEDNQDWDTRAGVEDQRDYDDSAAINQGCLGTAGSPPATGTYVLGSVDGVCQWIDTTTC